MATHPFSPLLNSILSCFPIRTTAQMYSVFQSSNKGTMLLADAAGRDPSANDCIPTVHTGRSYTDSSLGILGPIQVVRFSPTISWSLLKALSSTVFAAIYLHPCPTRTVAVCQCPIRRCYSAFFEIASVSATRASPAFRDTPAPMHVHFRIAIVPEAPISAQRS